MRHERFNCTWHIFGIYLFTYSCLCIWERIPTKRFGKAACYRQNFSACILKRSSMKVTNYLAVSWALDNQMENKISAFDIWIFGRMFRISHLNRKTNVEVLEMVKLNSLLNTVQEKKLQYFGHLIRGRGKQNERIRISKRASFKQIQERLWNLITDTDIIASLDLIQKERLTNHK